MTKIKMSKGLFFVICALVLCMVLIMVCLLVVPSGRADEDVNFTMGSSDFAAYRMKESFGKVGNELSEDCKFEWNYLQSKNPRDLIKEYCGVVDKRLLLWLFVVGVLWLIEPRIKRELEKNEVVWNQYYLSSKWLIFVYKWIGLGILFMIGYAIFMVSNA